MPIDYVAFEAARAAHGLRMVVVPGVPSPWSEAAKGLLHVKKIPWKAVRLDTGNAAMLEWTREPSGPVAFYDDEPPRSGWVQILLLTERLAPRPAMIPADPTARATMMGLAHEICGENGLGWMRRLQGVEAGLRGEPGFPKPVAEYLARKYGYREADAATYGPRVREILGLLAARLLDQRERGSRFYLGGEPTALDLYSATFMALFRPLPPEDCAMVEALRPGFEALDDETAAALDPILIEHRDFVYQTCLERPLSL